MKFNIKLVLVIVGTIIVGTIAIAAFFIFINDNDRSFDPVNANPEIIIIPQEYEVTNVYRVYDGSKLLYGLDYIDNGTIPTIVLPTYYKKIVVIPNPVNDTYLVYKERWVIYDNGNIEPGDNRGDYELHLSNNTPINGAPTFYSRARQSDFHSTVIIT